MYRIFVCYMLYVTAAAAARVYMCDNWWLCFTRYIGVLQHDNKNTETKCNYSTVHVLCILQYCFAMREFIQMPRVSASPVEFYQSCTDEL